MTFAKKMTRLLTITFCLLSVVSCQTILIKTKNFPDTSDFHGSLDSTTVIANSREDLMLLKREKDPIHARCKAYCNDGGTRHFEGTGYRIVDHQQLTSKGGLYGKIQGQTITFDRSATGSTKLEYSNAKFIPSKLSKTANKTLHANP